MYRTYSYNDMPIPVQRRNEDMRKQEMRQNQPARTKKKSYDIEL